MRLPDPRRPRGHLRRTAAFLRFSLLWLACSLIPSQASGVPDPCSQADAARVLGRLSCLTAEQLHQLNSYSNPGKDEHMLREALSVAAVAARCANHSSFEHDPESSRDLHCLRSRLLDFYRKVAPDAPRPEELDRTKPRIPTPVHSEESESPKPLRHQDLLARAATRIHFCMSDTTLPIADCLHLVDEALSDYQFVFEAAAKIRSSPDSREAQELAEKLGFDQDNAAPDADHLKIFVELALDNVLRFPLVLGKRVGAFLRPVLCAADETYPEHRDFISYHYNLLVRYDEGNVASAGQIFRLLGALEEMFHSGPAGLGYLDYEIDGDREAARPCNSQGGGYFFPRLKLRSGFRIPPADDFRLKLDEIEEILKRIGTYTERRDHLWQPFLGYGSLLSELADRQKLPAARSESAEELRHLLMSRARDVFLLRAVAPEKLPRDQRVLQETLRLHIQSYSRELFREARIARLIDFSEGCLEGDRGLLEESLRRTLHGLLAVAHTLQGDNEKALSHQQKSDMSQSAVESAVRQLKAAGIGVSIRP